MPLCWSIVKFFLVIKFSLIVESQPNEITFAQCFQLCTLFARSFVLICTRALFSLMVLYSSKSAITFIHTNKSTALCISCPMVPISKEGNNCARH
jgi:hypothetical protein